MKFSEIESLVEDYVVARYSPSRQAVHFGCDCGCGGNLYTRESWDAEERFAQDTIEKVKEFCHNMGIKYDGVE